LLWIATILCCNHHGFFTPGRYTVDAQSRTKIDFNKEFAAPADFLEMHAQFVCSIHDCAGKVIRRRRLTPLLMISRVRPAVTRPAARAIGGIMGITEIIASIDSQIVRLEQARALLGGSKATQGRNGKSSRGAAHVRVAASPAKRKKRNLSPEGRRRIAEAAKRRWEAHKKAAAAAVQK
jgi:hypothetical protein